MNRRGKGFLTSILGTIVGLGLLSAAPALAAEDMHYYAPSAPTTITGSPTTPNVITTSAGEIACATTTLSGTQATETSTELSLTPFYSGCTIFGIANSHFKTTGCALLFTTPTVRPTSSTYTVDPPHIACQEGASIEMTPTVPIFGTSVCTIKFPAQTPPSGHVIMTNQGSGNTRDILMTNAYSGIQYTVEGGGGLCGTSGSDASFKGSMTLRGYNDTGSGHVSHNGTHEPIEVTGGVSD